MHIMVATDGSLDPGKTADFLKHLIRPDDRVTVLTVVEIPRSLLSDLRALFEQRDVLQGADTDDEYVSPTPITTLSPNWPGDDTILARYVDDQRERRAEPLVQALTEAGLNAEAVAVEGADPTRPILEAVEREHVDLLCAGAHGRGMFEGLLGSTSTRLARRAPCPVLLIRI
ncbi:MAG: universal stress protein [Actinobacteria bacterium]|nr:universal stress protein [Actinomycetota bacterium]